MAKVGNVMAAVVRDSPSEFKDSYQCTRWGKEEGDVNVVIYYPSQEIEWLIGIKMEIGKVRRNVEQNQKITSIFLEILEK